MDISKEQINPLNAVVKIAITKADYEDKVNTILKDYRKQANIPGFRKGQVPIGLIKKQYGKTILVDEINKLLQDNLNKYLIEEKLDVLGNPLPKLQENFSWNDENFDFEFELGLTPEIEVNLKTKKPITYYKILVDKKMIDEQVERIKKQYGKIIPKSEITKDSEVRGIFYNEEAEIDNETTIDLAKIKSKKAISLLLEKKTGESVILKTKGLFKEDHHLFSSLGITSEKGEKLNINVTFTIGDIYERELAVIDQELLDKVYGKSEVKNEDEMVKKITTDTEKQFQQQSDQKLLNDVTERLIAETKFDLPKEFLKKWIQASGEKQLTDEEAADEFEKLEKGLRHQLIEGKLIKEYKLQVQFDELKAFAKDFVKSQMAQYGYFSATEEMLEDMASKYLSKKDEAKNLSEQLMNQKLLKLYKEMANLKTKEISFQNFVKAVYG